MMSERKSSKNLYSMNNDVKKEFEDVKNEIAAKIKAIRKEKRMRQEDFERGHYALSVPTLQRIEYGKANPSLLQIWKICKHLEIELHQLFE